MSSPGEAQSLSTSKHWVFDLDGTLTVAVHDFDAIRRALGIAHGEPILEALESMPPDRAQPLYERLDELELSFAKLARAQAGAAALLEALLGRGARLGIVTRNSETIAHETLRRCGLDRYFSAADIVGRESARAKPSPAGIELLLGNWSATGGRAVMVGDYLYDIEAGARAGCITVYYDPDAHGYWDEHADLRVRSHAELLHLASA